MIRTIAALCRKCVPLTVISVLLACAFSTVAVAAEHAPATPQREASAAQFLAYSPAAPVPAAVCFVDTGIDVNPDTAGALLHSEAVVPGQAQTGDTDLVRKHGTKALGVAVAPRNDWGTVGIWPQLKAISINGTRVTAPTFPFDAYRLAIKRCGALAADFPIVAINLSLGTTDVPTDGQLLQLLDAVAVARANGIHVVASAGNLGGTVETPASVDGVFAVGASDPATGALCSFSARGAGIDVLFPACGSAVASPAGEPIFANGTTYASPGTAAVLAALRAFSPALTVEDAERIVRDTAAARGGVVDARAAFVAAGLSWVVAEGERRAAESEVTTDPPERQPPDQPPLETPPADDDVAPRPSKPNTSSGRLPRPRVVAERRRRTLTIRLLNRPRGARTTVVLEARQAEFSWRQRDRRVARGTLVRLALPRSVRVARARVRVRYAADLKAAASTQLTIPVSRFRLGLSGDR